jgi:hypothetical protein
MSAFSVTFGFTSNTRKLAALSAELGITPSFAFEIGDEVQSRTGIHRRGASVWQLRSEGQIASDDIEEHISWLLGKIAPCRLLIQNYIDDVEVVVHIRINCSCPDSIGGVSVRSNMMRQLSTLSNRIDVNFIGELSESAPTDAGSETSKRGHH